MAVRQRIATRLRRRRDALGLSAAALAARCGISRGVIANFENLRTSMTVEAYFAVATALGVEPDVFMREVVCERCAGLPPQGFSCPACGAGRETDPCMACHGDPPAGFICRACGTEGADAC